MTTHRDREAQRASSCSAAGTAAELKGVAIEAGDLGSWGGARLIAEYDPAGPTIRLNARELASAGDSRYLEELAIAHELYHHLEHVGAIPRLSSRRAREAAADAYAHALVDG